MPTDLHPAPGSIVALKEWGAVVHALLDGRQSILLRKGGIHEKAFATPGADAAAILFPTVAHTHADRTRPEHRDLLPRGAADVAEDAVVLRARVRVVEVIDVVRPDEIEAIEDLHVWTSDSVRADRIDFRPTQALQVLVVQAMPLLPERRLERLDVHGGCRSWLDLDPAHLGGSVPRWGAPSLTEPALRAVAARVRDAVG